MTICSCLKPNTKSVENGKASQIKGNVWLMRKNVLKITDVRASLLDRVHELLGNRVSIQLISSDRPDPANGLREKLGKPSHLEKWVSTITPVKAGPAKFKVTFDWDESMGVPGAFIIRNNHHSQFYLKTVTLEVPGHGQVHFVCNSWVYPAHRYKYNRVFFCNKTYLPCQTPGPLKKYREEELINLRGNGEGMLKEWDRVYDYDVYNDLGKPEAGKEHARPVLGGSQEYPYPRRGRTGRKANKKDPKTESRLPALSPNIYVPGDERFSHLKFTESLCHVRRSFLSTILIPMIKYYCQKPFNDMIKYICHKPFNEFDSLKDVYNLYQDNFKLLNDSVSDIRGVLVSKGHKLPVPDVIKVGRRTAWRTDEEFGREMVAGVNPVIISRLQEFPPTSKLDPMKFGNQNSTITKKHIEVNMNGLTVSQAIDCNRLFILDHHDALMPYLKKINSTTTKTYASRTILLLQDDGTLKPLAIELSLPHPQGDEYGAVSKVFTPAKDVVEESVWQLAKAYVAVNDSGYHQLISHWLNTHAVIEPFVIASNRRLSVLHPIYKLLQPHFRDTMNINALARQFLINADGLLEKTVFPAKYSMEMSSFVYKNWIFTEQGLPADLLKRGVAVPDSSKKHGLRLLIEDYPYAVDGLEIWSAIETWVQEYCAFYYATDALIQQDHELQEWWAEVRTKGHGDKKDEPWWPKMQTLSDLTESCTIIIWVASALHAAVNFGQYPYAGYLPNRPTVSRRFMPEQGTPEYAELEKDLDLAFLRTITAKFQTVLGVSLIEILSTHATEEVYLGQREPDWTSDSVPLEAFKKFGETLEGIEKKIMEMNDDKRLKNRVGPVHMPYTWLIPNTADYSRKGGITNKGVPNSISI